MTKRAAATLCLVALLAGCHAPEVVFSGTVREVGSSAVRVVTDLPAAEAARTQAWLDARVLDMCARWQLPIPRRDPLRAYLFASPEDFVRFRQYDGLLRGGHRRQSGTCLGFYCAGCDAFATSPAIARDAPALDDPSSWRPLEHVLAHELNHHLLDRHGARGTPSWLSEGVAELEGLRAWAARDGGAARAPSQLYRALALSALALRGLYGERVLLDLDDRGLTAVTWGQEYSLDLALCHALQDLDRRLLRTLATGGALPEGWDPARLDRALRERALLGASEALLALARADARAWPATSALLAELWDAPAAAELRDAAADAAWSSLLGGARAQLEAGRGLSVRLSVAERDDPRAGLARARRAVWLLAEAADDLAPGERPQGALGDLELWLLGDLERRALSHLPPT